METENWQGKSPIDVKYTGSQLKCVGKSPVVPPGYRNSIRTSLNPASSFQAASLWPLMRREDPTDAS
ncbi:hypothetical protein DKX38_010053 [Salix brachista]|uniref:Uncharacterized protein n=1 Tax=Salix brachista TaxID=2182728 RepID=A0A5N5MCQ4_9ROSI|nr:hypothetical protein DKX38_010053 [Salix brachista]